MCMCVYMCLSLCLSTPEECKLLKVMRATEKNAGDIPFIPYPSFSKVNLYK